MISAPRWLWAAPFLLAAVALAINPIGYIGTGSDDFAYLQAARCWVEHGGPCLPVDHWGARWPVIAPLAGSLALFGESRASVGLAPLLWWLAGIACLGLLGERWFDRRTGIIAACFFATIPVLTIAALAPGADIPENSLQLAALLVATCAWQKFSRGWAVAAGVLAAFAFETRETSIVFIGVAALALALALALAFAFLAGERKALIPWIIAGAAGTIAAEALIYLVSTGDPLTRYRLALHHSALFSSELDPAVDRSRSALFNPAFIAGWKREMGIRLFWPLDPWLNMLATPRLGPLPIAAMTAALLWRRTLVQDWRHRVVLVIGAALLTCAGLIYGLAIDPKARMFLILAAASSLALGALMASAMRRSNLGPVILLGTTLVGIQLAVLSGERTTHQGERIARQWIDANPGAIEIDGAASNYLTLVRQARVLPPRGSGKALLIAVTPTHCETLIPAGGRSRLVAAEPRATRGEGGLCLFRYG